MLISELIIINKVDEHQVLTELVSVIQDDCMSILDGSNNDSIINDPDYQPEYYEITLVDKDQQADLNGKDFIEFQNKYNM